LRRRGTGGIIFTLTLATQGRSHLRRLILIALVVLGAPPARAELASRREAPRAVTIVVFGDSLAEGLWASLHRHFARDREASLRVRVVNATKASTGFNADAYDAALDRLLGRGGIDLLIVQTGANDRQRAIALDGHRVARFGTPRWFAFYSQRLGYFLAHVQQRRIPVLWVGLPVMRDEAFDRGMRVISRLQQHYAERHGASFLDIAGFTGDADGLFFEKLAGAGGRLRQFRHADGVHFWEFGYDRVAAEVLATIRSRFPGLLPERQTRAELLSHKP
jgi:hypothetical protein